MGIVYYRQGKQEEALGAYSKALEIQLKVLGPEHPDVAGSYGNLGNIYNSQGKQEEALGAHGDLEPAEKNVLRAVYYLRNKGQFVSYASQLLRREPPQWQQDRKLSWGEKEFDVETYVDGKYVRKLKAKNVVCHLWDGETCLGEKYLYKEGRPCRYARAHQPGRSTLNLEKLRDQAARYQVGHKIPELLENMCNRSGRSPLSDKGRIPGQENP